VTSPTLVLYVEDDPTHVVLARRILERQGFTLKAVHDGEQALRSLRSARPDVLLVDLGLPGPGGLALIRTIRELGTMSDLPIVAVSASTVRGEVRRALAAGANAFVEKPYTMDELVAALRAVEAP
jgi:CheY-like chemotaxis protein